MKHTELGPFTTIIVQPVNLLLPRKVHILFDYFLTLRPFRIISDDSTKPTCDNVNWSLDHHHLTFHVLIG